MPRLKSSSRNAHRLGRSPHMMVGDSDSSDEEEAPHAAAPQAALPTDTNDSNEVVSSEPAAVSEEEEAPAMLPVMESPPDGAILRERRRLAAAFGGKADGVSPYDVDGKRKRSLRLPKSTDTLAQRLAQTELSEKRVAKIIEKLYQEQENDDREMYNLSMQLVREETKCEMSDIVEELSATDFRRLLTYGEVSVESISQTVLPFLKLEADDVFYDLGCGTGKIVIQVALQTPCMVSKGIELMLNRVVEGSRALSRLESMKLPVLNDKEIQIVQGDILKPPAIAPLMDATVVFINNVCFTPELMLKVLDVLSRMPKLRRVVTLRKICERHRPLKCARAGNYCIEYGQPPEEAEIKVSWAHKTSVYLYEKIDFSLGQLVEQL